MPVPLFAAGSPWVVLTMVPLSCLAGPDKRNAESIPDTLSALDAIFSDSGYESDFTSEDEDDEEGLHPSEYYLTQAESLNITQL